MISPTSNSTALIPLYDHDFNTYQTVELKKKRQNQEFEYMTSHLSGVSWGCFSLFNCLYYCIPECVQVNSGYDVIVSHSGRSCLL